MSTSNQLDDLVARLQPVRDEDLASESRSPGAVQADPGRVARAPEHRRDLAGIELFPGGEREQLAVLLTQPCKRCGHRSKLVIGICPLPVRRGRLCVEPARDPSAPPFASPLVGKRVARDSVEPRSSVAPMGYLLEAAPGCEEGLGHGVLRVLAGDGSPEGVAENAVVVRVVDGAKPRPAGGVRSVRRSHPIGDRRRRCPACGHGRIPMHLHVHHRPDHFTRAKARDNRYAPGTNRTCARGLGSR